MLENDCLKSDVYGSWAVQQQNNAFAEKYSDWADAALACDGYVHDVDVHDVDVDIVDVDVHDGDALRRLSDEAPADAKVAALEA